MYRKRGFTITDVYGDNNFNHQAYMDTVLPARLHICAKGEHVPIVERSIRTVKENKGDMSELAIQQDAKNNGMGTTRVSRDMAKSVSANKQVK